MAKRKFTELEKRNGEINARRAVRRFIKDYYGEDLSDVVTKCECCKHATKDGFCLVFGKWTLLDITHACTAFDSKEESVTRTATKAKQRHGISLENDLKFATGW